MIVIGIDQSYTSTGIVALDDTEILLAETFCTTFEVDDVFKRAWSIRDYVVNAVNHIKPHVVVIEGLSFGNLGNVTRNLAGLQFLIVCELRFTYGHKVVIVPPKTLKKAATGNGGCSKQDMIDSLPTHVRTNFLERGYKKSTGLKDIADAYWLCKYIFVEGK